MGKQGSQWGTGTAAYPRLRLAAVLWLLLYVPAYAGTHGWWHFLFLCNLGVIVTALGFVFGNQLLLSSQALLAPGIALLWIADVGSQLVTGQFLHGATAYMWDASLPALVRALSLYHVAWPAFLVYALRRYGYDRRALRLQGALLAVALMGGLLLAPVAENINYVRHWPGFPSAEPLKPHIVALMGAMLLVAVCWPTHRICLIVFRASARRTEVGARQTRPVRALG
jgi:hypothetical protein